MFIVSLHRISEEQTFAPRSHYGCHYTLYIIYNMTVELILPIDALHGKLRNDGFYFRVTNGKQVIQRTPTKWRDTPARKAAREKFIAKYGRPKTKDENDTRP